MTSQEYKQQVDLVELAHHVYGFQLNHQKSTKRQAVLMKPQEEERVIVSKHSTTGHYLYFNPDDDQDRGTVIDFVLRREGGDWERLRKVMNDFLGNHLAEQKSFHLEAAAKNQSIPVFELLPFTDRSYLYQRGLTNQTLDDPIFRERIFHQKAAGLRGQYFLNTAFPCTNLDGQILGLELKNAGFTGHAEGSLKSEACWTSQYRELTLPVGELVIVEGAIDGLSYHQLHPATRSRIYLSTGGMLLQGQINLIQDLIHLTHARKIILATDNDLAGVHYNLQLLGYLKKPNHVYRLAAMVSRYTKTHFKTIIRFEPGQPAFIREAMLNLWKNDVDAEIEVSNTQELHIILPRERSCMERLEQSLLKTRKHQDWIQIHRPQAKDFNEDLVKSFENP